MTQITQNLARQILIRWPFLRGQGRLVDKTWLRNSRFPDEPIQVTTRYGFTMKVIPNDLIGRHLFFTGQFDRTIVEVLLSFLQPEDRVFDIGANVGFVSCCLLSAGGNCKVFAVEPQQECYQILHENVRSVGGERGDALNVAVSDSSGFGKMSMRKDNRGASELLSEEEYETSMETQEVSVLDGAELLERSGFDRVDLIKIDVEGHEERVLNALKPLIKKHWPRAIVFEHHRDLNNRSSSLRDMLESMGYKISAVRKGMLRWSLVPITVGSPFSFQTSDYVATPK